jgi:hypothetical protein
VTASPPATKAEVTDGLRPGVVQEGLPGIEVDPLEQTVLKLKERFILPPFTVLDARQGPWQNRKRDWIRLGLRSEEGRDARMLAKSVGDEWLVDPETGEEYLKGAEPGTVNQKILAVSNGQSIFDPVLCQLMYQWYCPAGGMILDPYAGGSVRGLVAAHLGREYHGIDLSARQIDANTEQADDWAEKGLFDLVVTPTWYHGDSWKTLADSGHLLGGDMPDGPYDFIFSCPPYHDLEVYSDDPDDLSNMPWSEFARRYKQTIEGAVERLADDRFAAFVVGEIRESPGPGYYRNLIGLTVDAFEAGGAAYYNEVILVTSVGTLPLRTAKQFMVSRKMGRTHQTILVFVKGDPRRAAEACYEKAVIEAAVGPGKLDAVEAAPEDDERADDLTVAEMANG